MSQGEGSQTRETGAREDLLIVKETLVSQQPQHRRTTQ